VPARRVDQVLGFRLPASGFGLPASGFGFRLTCEFLIKNKFTQAGRLPGPLYMCFALFSPFSGVPPPPPFLHNLWNHHVSGKFLATS
jgi:hypothetical protein